MRSPGPVELPEVDRVRAAWRHEGLARDLVLGLKLGGKRIFAAPLVDALAAAIVRTGTQAELVAWPPCSRAAERRRGFDHAEVLARGVARRLGLPARGLLRRVGRTADQAGLSGEARRANLRGAFAAASSPQAVLLVDDVVTTGATLRACAEVLRGQGAEWIEGAAACSAFSS